MSSSLSLWPPDKRRVLSAPQSTGSHDGKHEHEPRRQSAHRTRLRALLWLAGAFAAAHVLLSHNWRSPLSCASRAFWSTPSTPSLPVQTQKLSDNGLTDVVQWDGYSLFVYGQRVFLWCVFDSARSGSCSRTPRCDELVCCAHIGTRRSGEFHTFRLPVPSLWPDILEKMKAAGMNGVSIYIDWWVSCSGRVARRGT